MAYTPTKQSQKEWVVPPSPKSLEAMYEYTKTQHLAPKNDVMELFKRLNPHYGKDFISQVIIQEEPLLKAYYLYLEANKKMSIPIVVLSDSTTSANIGTTGVNAIDDDDATTAATQSN